MAGVGCPQDAPALITNARPDFVLLKVGNDAHLLREAQLAQFLFKCVCHDFRSAAPQRKKLLHNAGKLLRHGLFFSAKAGKIKCANVEKREEQTKKRYRKKPTDTVRLCADDIMTRLKLKSYQDTYAEAMAKYGLQRGIDGSKARHKSTQQYYRDIQKLSDNLKAEVVDLQQQKETAREELRRAKKEIQTEKLKEAATVAATNIAESVGSLFGSNKVKTLERENTALHREVADHEETIEALQDRIQTMQTDHNRQLLDMQQKHGREIADKEARHKEEISFLKAVVARAAAWFPYFREMLRIENLCRLVGFDERQTATLVKGKQLEYEGELYSEEHKRKFKTEKAGFQVLKDPTDGTKLVLAIDRKPIAEWFKEQFDKLRQSIHRPIQPQRKSRGMKL